MTWKQIYELALHDTDTNVGYYLQTVSAVAMAAAPAVATLSLGWWALTVMVALLGGVAIVNIILIAVQERTREIGMRRVCGATLRDIRWHFLLNVGYAAAKGCAYGLLAGIGFSYMCYKSLVSQAAPLINAALILVIVMGLCLLVCFLTANRAATMEPVEALRYD